MILEQKRAELHRAVQRIALQAYLRQGFVPGDVKELLAVTASAAALMKYRPDQPRHPAGSPVGGRWTNGQYQEVNTIPGHRKPQRNHTIDVKTRKRAMAIYGETAGLLPILIDVSKDKYDPRNWNHESYNLLQTARTYIGITSERNNRVHFAFPTDLQNPIVKRSWDLSILAAKKGKVPTQLNRRVTHFFIRQAGVGKQVPPWPELSRLMSIGPFLNIGGGDVPRGRRTYVDFYGK